MSAKRSSHGRSEPARRSPLKARREKAAQFVMWLCVIAIGVAVGALFYCIWQPAVRVQKVEVNTENGGDQIELLTRHDLQGSYLFIIPKDSIFFYPEATIEKDILSLRPDIASASVHRSGFSSLSVQTVSRIPAYWWCGDDRSDGNETSCYEADWAGFVFLPVPETDFALSSLTRIYVPLTTAAGTAAYPLTSTLTNATAIPEIFALTKEIKSLGAVVTGIRIHSDEVSLYTSSGTYVTYLLGHEKEALSLLTAALPSLSLTDGSVEYLDLRFDGKIYIKKKGEVKS